MGGSFEVGSRELVVGSKKDEEKDNAETLRTQRRATSAEGFAEGCPGVVAEPAELRESFAEFCGDGRREPGVDVIETARVGFAFGGGVEMKQRVPAFTRCAGVRIEQKICFGGEAQQGSADDFWIG